MAKNKYFAPKKNKVHTIVKAFLALLLVFVVAYFLWSLMQYNEAMEKILKADSLPRAVVCAYDDMAIGAIRCITDHGLRVPEDIAVMGMDDIPQAPYMVPPLASIDSRLKELCKLTAKTVTDLIDGKDVPMHQTISATLQLRKSLEIE